MMDSDKQQRNTLANDDASNRQTWQTPELSVLPTDDTEFTANPGNDGIATVS
ncbi:hypothetical protein [Celerinatantimonas sp. YJH-8]|uniref:hypothetical protein n=1 Tax=Celerinatantimonas sp. YJH-8 TaxID=3228714 RepID=UPI0038C6B572